MTRRQCLLAALAGLVSPQLQAGSARLDMELALLDGSGFRRLGQARAHATVINFWDTQCPPCVEELPMLDQLSQTWHDVLWVGVSLSPAVATRAF